MLNASDLPQPGRQALSSLMDGDLADDQWPAVAAAWHRDTDQCATWHCYQLIGDVLRSDELAGDPRRDSAMLLALRGRLAQEPVPLAPRALPPAGPPGSVPGLQPTGPMGGMGRWGRWGRSGWSMVPMAVAAGFVAVAGVLVVVRSQAPSADDASQLAAGNAATGSASLRRVASVESGVLVRNAGLDRYLEAHRKLGNSVTMASATDQRVQIVFETK